MSCVTLENPSGARIRARRQENAYFALRDAGMNHRAACTELAVTRFRAEELLHAYNYSRRVVETPETLLADLDAQHVAACLREGGFSRGVMFRGQMVQVRP